MKLLKKGIIAGIIFLSLGQGNIFAAQSSTVSAPGINCYGLPGCVDTDKTTVKPGKVGGNSNIGAEYIVKIIALMLQYVSVVAVISLMISGFLYLFSGGEEEKVKKAKNWIVWSLVGVFLSMSAWFLVSVVNNFSFT